MIPNSSNRMNIQVVSCAKHYIRVKAHFEIREVNLEPSFMYYLKFSNGLISVSVKLCGEKCAPNFLFQSFFCMFYLNYTISASKINVYHINSSP
jgi:hypothetical protein